MSDWLSQEAAREWRAERDANEPIKPRSHGARTLMQIEDWDRLANRLIESKVVEARALGFELRVAASRERERHAKGDFLTARTWWEWEREMRKAGLR